MADRVVADSTRGMLHVAFGTPVLEQSSRPLLPGYFFPTDDVDVAALTRSEPWDDRTWWHLHVDGVRMEDAAWAWADPSGPVADLTRHVTFRWEAMDAWCEGADQVFVHARDPRTRGDVPESTRHVRVRLGDLVLAEGGTVRPGGHPAV